MADQEVKEPSNEEIMAQLAAYYEKRNALPSALTPQQRLAQAASGERRVEIRDLESILAGLINELEMQASLSGGSARGLIAMILSTPPSTSPSQEELLFGDEGPKSFDVNAALGLAERLTRLQSVQASELRRTIDLLHRMIKPPRPRVSVYAAADQINVADQQINSLSPVSLGDPER